MIEVHGLTKAYGKKTVVSDLSFTVEPGRVTGFLGPNGAGKTTTMRLILGLEHPDAGTVRINGVPYHQLKNPLTHVGALMDARHTHPLRTARNHLRWVAASNGIDDARVDECLDIVGLSSVAGQRTKGFSLGMRQRLGIAETLLGDPQILLFDEPVNGLDPEGIAWFRNLARSLAQQGRSVFVSSHLLSEISQTSDHLIVIGQGKLLEDTSIDDFTRQATPEVRVRTKFSRQLLEVLAAHGITGKVVSDTAVDASELGDVVIVSCDTTSRVADIAATHNIPLYELSAPRSSVEERYLRLTQQWETYRGEFLGKEQK